MTSKKKLKRRAKRAAIKKKYSDLKANKSKRVDDRVSHISTLERSEETNISDEELGRRFGRSINRYKNKNLID